MGLCTSRSAAFADKFTSWDEARASLRASGFEDSDLVIAIDNTGSNDVKGWGGKGLHDVDPSAAASGAPATPYEVVLSALGERILALLDRDHSVPMYGFGDSVTTTHASGCRLLGHARSIGEAQAAYRDYVTDERIGKSGPTSLAGVIRQVMDRVRQTGRFHTLIVLTDGAVDDEPEGGGPSPTAQAIVDAAALPLEIIAVGIGTGPWDAMVRFDDALPHRRVDNFQFVRAPSPDDLYDPVAMSRFAADALQELPQLWSWLRKHSMFGAPSDTERDPALPAPVAAKDYGMF